MTASPNSTRIQVHVHPNAARNEITGCSEGVLRIKIAAPPVRGKANQELVSFLSRMLNIKKSSVSILREQTARNKLVAIEGLDYDSVAKLLIPEQKRLLKLLT